MQRRLNFVKWSQFMLGVLMCALFLFPVVAFGALSEDFTGGALPTGWSESDPGASGSTFSYSDTAVTVTTPASQNTDTIFNTSSVDNSVGVTHAVAPGDLDIAVQLDNDISQFENLSVNLLFFGSTNADAARFSIYQAGQPRAYSYARSGGAGGGVGPTILASTNDWFQGIPAWLRVTYASSTGVWTFYGSADGANWDQIIQNTRSFDAETFKISLSSFNTFPGGSLEINRVVDIAALGSTDVRSAIAAYERTSRVSFSGTDGSLPAGLVDDSANSGSITWTGSALRFTSNLGIDGSRARLRYTGTTYDEAGTLTQFQFAGINGNLYSVFGIGEDTGGIDQYARGPGYAWEGNPSTNRVVVRIDEPGTAATSFNDQYTFLIDDLGSNLGGTPGAVFWARIERVEDRVRARIWQDGSTEPSTWDYDGEDEMIDGPFGPALALTHNDGTTGGDQYMDVLSFDFYEITEPDTTDPSVSVVTPGDGDTATGTTVLLEAAATDNVAVAGVQFYVGGDAVGSEVTATSGPDRYAYTFDSTGVSDGDYTVVAVARDGAGNYATSAAITITIDNVVEAEPEPEAASDSSGSSSGGSVAVRARQLAERGDTEAAAALAERFPRLFDDEEVDEVARAGLRAQLEMLEAQLRTLLLQVKARLGGEVPAPSLGLGMTDARVKRLQVLLNARGYTIATSGAGAPGQESMYFGPRTQAALIRYQLDNNIAPAAGYYGPITAAALRGSY